MTKGSVMNQELVQMQRGEIYTQELMLCSAKLCHQLQGCHIRPLSAIANHSNFTALLQNSKPVNLNFMGQD